MSGRARAALHGALGFAPTRRLAALVACIAPVWLLSGTTAGWLFAALCTTALALAVLLDVALLPAARDLEVHRDLPATLGVGDRVEGHYRLESRWGRPLTVSVHDAALRGVRARSARS